MASEGVSCPHPLPSPLPTLLPASCLGMLPGGWPQADNRPSVLHLLQVIQADVLIQLNHFVHPEDVCHAVVGEDDDIEVVLQLSLLREGGAGGGQHSAARCSDPGSLANGCFKLQVIGEGIPPRL